MSRLAPTPMITPDKLTPADYAEALYLASCPPRELHRCALVHVGDPLSPAAGDLLVALVLDWYAGDLAALRSAFAERYGQCYGAHALEEMQAGMAWANHWAAELGGLMAG